MSCGLSKAGRRHRPTTAIGECVSLDPSHDRSVRKWATPVILEEGRKKNESSNQARVDVANGMERVVEIASLRGLFLFTRARVRLLKSQLSDAVTVSIPIDRNRLLGQLGQEFFTPCVDVVLRNDLP